MGIVIWLSWKLCGKMRNCSVRAISPFPTIFSKALLLLMHQNEYLWSKGLRKEKTMERICSLFRRVKPFFLWPWPVHKLFAATVKGLKIIKLWSMILLVSWYWNIVMSIILCDQRNGGPVGTAVIWIVGHKVFLTELRQSKNFNTNTKCVAK